MVISLVSALKRFNRKERNWLIRDALGAGADALCLQFRTRVADTMGEHGFEVSIPPDAWWATDYHIDWLIGALTIMAEGDGAVCTVKPNRPGFVTGSQQDIDLLIAWGTTIVLIEAKGVGSWSGTGTSEKLARLKQLPGSPVLRAYALSHFYFAGLCRRTDNWLAVLDQQLGNSGPYADDAAPSG